MIPEDKAQRLILWFDQVTNADTALVGGKNASLGEMYTRLVPEGVNVPNGFAVTAHAYRVFLDGTNLRKIIQNELSGFDARDVRALARKGSLIRKAFLKEEFPPILVEEIKKAYRDLSGAYQAKDVDVAVRSSATAEDLPGASFAGEHETFLNISGERALMTAVRAAMASLFTDRAISYRIDKGFDHLSVSLSVGVQKMVRSDKACSGVMFTLDTETGFPNVVEINASWGLGEMVVQGKVTPDEFIVFKPTLAEGYAPIIRRQLGAKRDKMIYASYGSNPVKEIKTTPKERSRFTLSDEEVLRLARWGVTIESHYSRVAGRNMPMDIEWAKDGNTGDLFIVQARPETVQSEKKKFEIRRYTLQEKGEVIVEGIPVGAKIATGKARILLSTKDLSSFKDGEILVTEITDPDWEPIMKKAAAIITEKGGRTSHAAIVSRELGIPAVIGAQGSTHAIKTGTEITTDCSSGDKGVVYKGRLKWTEKAYNLDTLPRIKTHLALNIGSPEGAFVHGLLPHHGVGLAREEFIIASHIGVHPLALIHYDKIKNVQLKQKIDKITEGYKDKKEFYIERLSLGIGQIAAAFWPHQVIVRFSDFKTNEYRSLIGGDMYEPHEENPMLGWRGAARYAHEDFRLAFRLECEAVKRVRERFGLKNLATMVPFCRTPDEGRRVVRLMKEFGLTRGENGLRVYMMCEIPTNVLRADEFLDIFDGFSIGSNDLAQTTLGLDRDSSIVAGISNENDPAVRSLVATAISACKKRGKYIGFCGQAPSDYPEFLRFLVEQELDAISLNPDVLLPMMSEVAEEEGKMQQKRSLP